MPTGAAYSIRLNLDNLYKTDSGIPPRPVTPPKNHGNYCMRATARLEHSDGSEGYLAEFTGYSHTSDITKKVEEACKRYSNKVGKTKCSDVKLFFIGAHPKCDGRIECIKNLFGGE